MFLSFVMNITACLCFDFHQHLRVHSSACFNVVCLSSFIRLSINLPTCFFVYVYLCVCMSTSNRAKTLTYDISLYAPCTVTHLGLTTLIMVRAHPSMRASYKKWVTNTRSRRCLLQGHLLYVHKKGLVACSRVYEASFLLYILCGIWAQGPAEVW